MFSLCLLLLSFLSSPENAGVKEVNLEQLQAEVSRANDTLYVVNFWATWCKPCVAEMPYFEKAGQKFSDKKVKLVFVSLNYARELQVVDKFVKGKKIRSECLLLNAGNPNVWIDKIEKEWSGSIPATIMYRNGKKVCFHEGEFNQAEIDSIIQQKIQ
jgi:thiol-disulfide isomerase/thioredoxin